MRLMNLLFCTLLLSALLVAPTVFAQAPATGFPPYGSFQNGNFDAVNLQNLNVNFSIPLVSIPGRGMNFSSSIVYNSLNWQRLNPSPGSYAWQPVTDRPEIPGYWGWQATSPIGKVLYVSGANYNYCDVDRVNQTITTTWSNYEYVDPFGTRHPFESVTWSKIYSQCDLTTYESGTPTGYASDGSGYYLDITANRDAPIVKTPSGTVIKLDSAIDANGNRISSRPVGTTETDWTDSTGRVALRVVTVGSDTEYHFLDANGGDRKYVLRYQNYTVRTNFGCSLVTEYNASGTLPQVSLPYELELPNLKKYSFGYELTPGAVQPPPPNPLIVTGRLTTVTLPTGGVYEYSFPTAAPYGINCADGTVANFTRTLSGGASPAMWTYARSGSTTTVTAPIMPYDAASNQTTYTFDANAHENTQKIYQGSAVGTPVRTITTSWTPTPPPGTPSTPTSRVTTLEDGTTQSKTDMTYDAVNGNLLTLKEYDWGLVLLQTTTLEYNTDVNYTSRNILNLLSRNTIQDGGGVVQYRQDIRYDETPRNPCPTGAAQHDDIGYPCGFNYRGNPTSVVTYKTPTTSADPVTKTSTYDFFGNVVTATLNCCQQKRFNFSATTNYTFPDSIDRGTTPTLTTRATYSNSTGQVLTETDENNKVTNYAYNDVLKRITSFTRPDNAQITYAYDDTARTVTTTSPLQGTTTVTQTVSYNGLGQSILTAVTGGSKVQTTYDPVGRIYQTSNPFSGASAAYVTTKRFDALGRTCLVIPPDGTTPGAGCPTAAPANDIFTSYSGKSATFTDQAGKQRRAFSDALGRLVQVDEPAGGGPATSGTGSATVSGSERSISGSAAPTLGAGTGTSSSSLIGNPWTNPNNIATAGQSAICPMSATLSSEGLNATNFGFNIPSNATINGISASITRQDLNNRSILFDYVVYLLKAGSAVGTNHSVLTAWPYPAAAQTYGGSTDLWGTTWSPADINAANFGIQIAVENGDTVLSSTAAVTGPVSITVYYTVPVPVYDTGTTWVNVNNGGSGFLASVTYGQNSTATTVAADINAILNGASSPVTATVSGGTISITAKATGAATNYPVSCSSQTTSGSFPAGTTSFPISCSGLANGRDASGPSLATPNSTFYAYNIFDKISGVTQGAQTRTYVYDNLGRLKSVKMPETNQVATTLDYNDFDLPIARTDPRGVITNYGYDGLNRLYTVSYNVSSAPGVPATPPVTFTYGTDPAQNNNGRLLTMTDGPGSETYKYDILGQMKQLDKVISGVTYSTLYDYNLAGEMSKITYPSGRAVTPGYDTLGRLSTLSDTFNLVNTTYASGFVYNDAQQVTSFNYGNGVSATFIYSPDRLQLTGLSYTKSPQTLFGLNYWHKQDTTNCPSGVSGNNGQIQCVTDSVDTGRTLAYTYDELSRLKTARTNGSVSYPQWGLTWNYDRYANRSAQILTAGSGYQGSVTIDPLTNRITGSPYDLNGNLTNDGANALVYDGENQLVSAASASFNYDGNGLRVKKAAAASTVYIFSGSRVIVEYDNGVAPASPSREYIYAGSQMLAKIEGGVTQYYHADHLSVRMMTDSSGIKIGEQGHYPYGEGSWYATGTASKWKFTTYERDESGNDYATARNYINRLGRFNSPDPLGGSIANPQSLNLYAYVMNNPLNLIDPLGLCGEGDDPKETDCELDASGQPMNRFGSGGGNCTLDGLQAPCGLVQHLLSGGGLQACLNPPLCTVGADLESSLGGALVKLRIGLAVPAYRCDFGDCLVSPNWVEVYASITLGWFAFPSRPSSPVNPYIQEIARQLQPLNKLSDCAGGAVANQIPFGSKIFGTPKGPSDPVGRTLDTADKLADPKLAGRVALGLNKAGLPELSQVAGRNLAKISGGLAPIAGTISGANLAWMGYSATRETISCYNRPD